MSGDVEMSSSGSNSVSVSVSASETSCGAPDQISVRGLGLTVASVGCGRGPVVRLPAGELLPLTDAILDAGGDPRTEAEAAAPRVGTASLSDSALLLRTSKGRILLVGTRVEEPDALFCGTAAPVLLGEFDDEFAASAKL